MNDKLPQNIVEANVKKHSLRDAQREIERLRAVVTEQDEQIASLQSKVHLCAAYDRLEKERDHYRDSYHADHAKLVEALEREKVVRHSFWSFLWCGSSSPRQGLTVTSTPPSCPTGRAGHARPAVPAPSSPRTLSTTLRERRRTSHE